MIVKGEKTEEYRDDTAYYRSRFTRYIGQQIRVMFRNGYGVNRPSAVCVVVPRYGIGRPEWGATKHRCFVLSILNIESIRHRKRAEDAVTWFAIKSCRIKERRHKCRHSNRQSLLRIAFCMTAFLPSYYLWFFGAWRYSILQGCYLLAFLCRQKIINCRHIRCEPARFVDLLWRQRKELLMNDETVKYTLRIDKNFNNELDFVFYI